MVTKIRRCTTEDLEVLQKLSRETFTDTFGDYNTIENLNAYLDKAYDLATLSQEMNNVNSEFYFLYVDGILAGYLKINILDAQSEKMPDDFLEIQRIYVRKQFKRQGLGKILLKLAISRAKELHRKRIWLGVWESNFPAQEFYKYMGFTRFSEHRFVMGGSSQTDYILKKELRK
ncbi:N-acetyltransferase [Companilactobacillus musae]|uniref:GNAT family N-acetyltransferase n=1 Tax=Companilactobacillus musae TaxID=1903258 RepID=UPI000E6512DB|nr:N-acetyltransferase [Companilactobacillus musae]